jgi:hypothetical protein
MKRSEDRIEAGFRDWCKSLVSTSSTQSNLPPTMTLATASSFLSAFTPNFRTGYAFGLIILACSALLMWTLRTLSNLHVGPGHVQFHAKGRSL